ncbi:MAG: hypothetical protein ACRCTY_01050, partial [Candidatus Adiutrix sp.]
MSDNQNIATLLSLAAQKHPHRKAAICEHRPDVLGRTHLTYAELDESSSLLATLFKEKQTPLGSRIIVM